MEKVSVINIYNMGTVWNIYWKWFEICIDADDKYLLLSTVNHV